MNIQYASSVNITMDLSALGSSSTFVAGRESTQVDNSSNRYMGALVYGRFIVGTTPTLPCQLNVYLWGNEVALDGSAPEVIADVLDGTDSAETITNTTMLTNSLILARAAQILVNTSDKTYEIVPFNAADFFGAIMPPYWGLYVAHNMTAALKTDSGNTNSFRYQGITYV